MTDSRKGGGAGLILEIAETPCFADSFAIRVDGIHCIGIGENFHRLQNGGKALVTDEHSDRFLVPRDGDKVALGGKVNRRGCLALERFYGVCISHRKNMFH